MNRMHLLPKEAMEVRSPELFTYPFCYQPHPLCVMAANKVKDMLQGHPEWEAEIKRGKMFGVLVIEDKSGRRGFLAAFSGTLGGRYDYEEFVPAVYDLTVPDGYFQMEEKKISQINKSIELLETDSDFLLLQAECQQIRKEGESAVAISKENMQKAKATRDQMRIELTQEEYERRKNDFVKESQFLKAEVKRTQALWKAKEEAARLPLRRHEEQIRSLKEERKKRSTALQQWLFGQFRFRNAKGEIESLARIFEGTTPPSGAGECCAPKLLQYAYNEGMKPICMAEFWMGQSPKDELREEGHYYPACMAKCKPILGWMLQGLKMEENPLAKKNNEVANQLSIVYKDEWIVVVDKPSGMLSVPGKEPLPNVQDEIHRLFTNIEGPIIVHRLDLDTSGLMVLALTNESYLSLQQQFAKHTIVKQYTALLEQAMTEGEEGVIDLPLCPNPNDRPRQMVSREYGKRAITRYKVRSNRNGRALIDFWPETGRTHQLRLHAAHPEGLNNPIVGDRLYGHEEDRLQLYAQSLTFRHPATGETMKFELEDLWK